MHERETERPLSSVRLQPGLHGTRYKKAHQRPQLLQIMRALLRIVQVQLLKLRPQSSRGDSDVKTRGSASVR